MILHQRTLFHFKNDCFILQHQMQRFILILLFLIPLFIYAGKSAKWCKTPSGISYKIYTRDTSKAKPVYGDHIRMQLRKIAPDKKEVFNTKVFDAEHGVELDYKNPVSKPDVTEVFAYMGIGDSAQARIPANLIDSNGSKKKYYTFWLRLLDFKTKEDHEVAKNEQQQLQQFLDSLTIQDVLSKLKEEGIKQDAYGNWYLRRQQGTGAQIQNADVVNLHYIGKLTNGEEFDNSYFRNQTFSFTVGKKQVIEGLDKGICNFSIGDIGLLIIPSRLGYGDKAVGKIPANSVLIFELEIME